MATKPNIPVTREEMYLDVMTGGSSSLPEPITLEEMYLAKIAGMAVDLPTPRYIKHKFLAKIAGMQVDVPTYTTDYPRIYAYLAKAAGQDFEVPQPITREEMYWFDYVNGQPTPSEQEYTGAVPVTFVADGTPLLDYLISGNTVQSGTPTPDNPIMPEGTGEKTANLADLYNVNMTKLNLTFTTGNNMTVVINGTKADGTNVIPIAKPNVILPAGTYTVTIKMISGSITNTSEGAFFGINGSTYSQRTAPNVKEIGGVGKRTFTLSKDTLLSSLDITPSYSNTGSVWNDATFECMLYSGSDDIPYEPYGYKIPISSANTTTPVYLGEVETERSVKKLVLTSGSDVDNVFDYNGYIYVQKSGMLAEPIAPFCNCLVGTVLPLADAPVNSVKQGRIAGLSNPAALIFKLDGITTRSAFLSFLSNMNLAGTPVCVWYVLATPTTGIVNEPIRKIGDYTDSISMEQAGVQIPTNNGTTVIDVDTTVKPSEVYIRYKGEPIVGSQTSSQSSAYAPAEVSSQSENVDDINNSLLGKEEETE